MLHNSLGGVSFQLGEHMRSVECYVQYLTLSQEVPDSVHGEAAAMWTSPRALRKGRPRE